MSIVLPPNFQDIAAQLAARGSVTVQGATPATSRPLGDASTSAAERALWAAIASGNVRASDLPRIARGHPALNRISPGEPLQMLNDTVDDELEIYRQFAQGTLTYDDMLRMAISDDMQGLGSWLKKTVKKASNAVSSAAKSVSKTVSKVGKELEKGVKQVAPYALAAGAVAIGAPYLATAFPGAAAAVKGAGSAVWGATKTAGAYLATQAGKIPAIAGKVANAALPIAKTLLETRGVNVQDESAASVIRGVLEYNERRELERLYRDYMREQSAQPQPQPIFYSGGGGGAMPVPVSTPAPSSGGSVSIPTWAAVAIPVSLLAFMALSS